MLVVGFFIAGLFGLFVVYGSDCLLVALYNCLIFADLCCAFVFCVWVIGFAMCYVRFVFWGKIAWVWCDLVWGDITCWVAWVVLDLVASVFAGLLWISSCMVGIVFQLVVGCLF